MRFHYDKKEDILCIKFSDKPYQESEEVKDGVIFDYDKNGKINAIEILDASNRFSPKLHLALTKDKFPFSVAFAE